MSRDLTNLFIDETFQYLVQTSGSVFTDGTGSLLTEVDITASNAVSSSYALTASYALNSIPQVSASYATSASYAVSASQADNSISSSYAVSALSSSYSNTSTSASHALSADTSILADTASLLIGNAEQVSHIDFAVGGDATVERRLTWNDTDGTLNVGLKGGNVTLQVGQEEVARVVNGTGADLLEAQYRAVKVIGAQGQRLQVDLAQADSDLNSATTLGLVTEDINKNQEGFITTQGTVNKVNTTGALQGETWNDGDVLYLSATTPGVITNVKPVTPAHLIVVGYVEYAHQNNGKIYVKVDNGYELEELHDVLITNPTNGEALVYENGIWINSDIPHISASYAVSSSQAEKANSVVNTPSLGSNYMLAGNPGDDTVYRTNVLISGSNAIQANGGFFGNLTGNADTATSASYALTASYAENANIDSGSWDGQFEGDAGITGSLTFTGISATLDMGTGLAAQIKSNNITGSWGQTNPGGGVSIQAEEAISASSFIGPLTGNADTATSASYADLAENLTVGPKTHDGVFQQTVPIPAPFNETDFYTVTGANAGVYHIGLQDYTPYGEKFVHQGYLSEQFDSFGFNYGSAMGNSLTGCGYFLVPQGGGGTDAAVTTQDNGDGTATTAARGHKVNINGYNGVTISGSVFSQNDITAPNFIGNLQGNANTATTTSYATVAENLTSGDKIIDGKLTVNGQNNFPSNTFEVKDGNLQTVFQVQNAMLAGITGKTFVVNGAGLWTGNQDFIGAVSSTAGFTGNLIGNADTATNLTPGSKTLNGNINQSFNAGNVGLSTINGASVGATAYNNFTVGVQDIPAFGPSYEDCYILECYDSFGYNYGAEFKVNGVAAGFFMYPQTGGFGDPAGVQVLDNGGAGSQVQIYAKTIDFGLAGNTSTIGIGNTNSTTTMAGDLVLTGLGDYADDATAASNGVPLNGVYRTGNVIKIRIV